MMYGGTTRRISRTKKIVLVKEIIGLCLDILMLPASALDKPNLPDFKIVVENLQQIKKMAGNVVY